jgi:hypothetical protein
MNPNEQAALEQLIDRWVEVEWHPSTDPLSLKIDVLALALAKRGDRKANPTVISEPARRTVLDRLPALNHQRYEEELKAGLHEKKKGKSKPPKSEAGRSSAPDGGSSHSPQMELF